VDVEAVWDADVGGLREGLLAEGEGGEVGGFAEVVDLGDAIFVEVEGQETGIWGDVEGCETVGGEVEGFQVSERV